jgi:ABC-2 type transport system ATP-binding protein
VDGLAKSYGSVPALRGISFTVGAGEIFALLGPNGAGKTTTLEILEGFRARDAGRAEVVGLDPGDRRKPGIVERILSRTSRSSPT